MNQQKVVWSQTPTLEIRRTVTEIWLCQEEESFPAIVMLTAQRTHTELPLAALYSVSRLNIHSLIFSAEFFLELGGWGASAAQNYCPAPKCWQIQNFHCSETLNCIKCPTKTAILNFLISMPHKKDSSPTLETPATSLTDLLHLDLVID